MIVLLLVCMALPLFPGIYLFTENRGDALTRMAAWLTLKPYLATPLCGWIMSSYRTSAPDPFQSALAIAPGVILTMIIVHYYRDLIFGFQSRPAAWALLTLDVLRWGSTLLALLGGGIAPSLRLYDLGSIAWIAAVAMPVVFAFAALIIVSSANRQAAKPKRKPKHDDSTDEIVEI